MEPKNISGRVTDLATGISCDEIECRLYVGTAGGGLWRSDRALHPKFPRWRLLTNGLQSNNIGSITLDPNDPSGLTLRTSTGSARVTIEADVQDLGGRPHGQAGLRGVDVATLPLLELLIDPVELADLRARVGVELATTCPSLSATLRLDQASTAVIRTAGSCPLPLRDDPQRSIELPSLAIRATLAAGDGPARVELRAEMPHQLELDSTFWFRITW